MLLLRLSLSSSSSLVVLVGAGDTGLVLVGVAANVDCCCFIAIDLARFTSKRFSLLFDVSLHWLFSYRYVCLLMGSLSDFCCVVCLFFCLFRLFIVIVIICCHCFLGVRVCFVFIIIAVVAVAVCVDATKEKVSQRPHSCVVSIRPLRSNSVNLINEDLSCTS